MLVPRLSFETKKYNKQFINAINVPVRREIDVYGFTCQR